MKLPLLVRPSPRERLLREVATRFLRQRPLIVGPVMVAGLACLHTANAPARQMGAVAAGFSTMLTFFVYEAFESRRTLFSAGRVRLSLQLTLFGITVGCAATGGLGSPLLPMIFAPVVVGLAAFGLAPGARPLLFTLGAALCALLLTTLYPPFPLIGSPQRQVLLGAALLDSLVLVHVGGAAFTHAHETLVDELELAREGLLVEALERTRSVESLGARVAHEIKNPLASVRGLVELIGERLDHPRDVRRLEVLKNEVARLETLVHDYLTLARPLDDLRRSEANLVKVADEAVALLEGRAARAQITLSLITTPAAETAETDLSRMNVDAHRILLTLLNLLVNAVEATPPGGTVELAVGCDADGAVLTVTDSGRGISAEVRARLGASYVSTKAGGTGLGVALSKSIVEQHGGRLSFATRSPRGTVVTMTLPRRTPEAPSRSSTLLPIMARILLVDDDPGVRFTLEETLADRGHEVLTASSGDEAKDRLTDIDVLVTDVVMPGLDGMGLLAHARQLDAQLPVILLTAQGSERLAVAAMKAGAFDYLPKPFSIEEARQTVDRAAEVSVLRRTATRHAISHAVGRPLIGESTAFRRLLQMIERLADRELPVLVRGESGTGKELVATALHARSRRAAKPCIRFNCAAIPAELAEAELFGHTRGAFTGAAQARRGYFVEADGGTLVLDEVGELPLSVQPKLLRALQDGEIQPIGAPRPQRVDVRIVACTHRDLRAEVAKGTFRQDLYYRLAVLDLEVPRLRDRRDDIPLLAESFRLRCVERFGCEPVTFAPDLLVALAAREWPGNIRELENIVARLVAHATTSVLEKRDLAAAEDDDIPGTAGTPAGIGPLRERVSVFERGIIVATLAEVSQNQSETARRLGMTRVGLIEKMKRLGISRQK